MPSTLAGVAAALIVVGGCGGGPESPEPRPSSTFEKLYHEAETGEPEAQNIIGFMLFFGEVAPSDPALAAHWFLSAASQGNVSARFSMALTFPCDAADRNQ